MAQRRSGRAQVRPFVISRASRVAVGVLASGVLLLVAAPAGTLAHEGGARLILEPAQVNPGGVVVIRGEDLGADHQLRLALVGGGGQADLNTVVSDGEGHFTVAVQISSDAPAGRYSVSATGTDGTTITAPMSVEGAPVTDGDGAPPGQDEGLPALAPSAAAQASPGRLATVQSLPPGSTKTPPATTNAATAQDADIVPLVALAGAVAALGLLFWRTRRSRAAESAELS